MRYNFDNIPKELTDLHQWVCAWDGSKIPMRANEKRAAASSVPTTWCAFEEAKEAVTGGRYDYLGFVFNNNGIVGIDIDKGFDENGFLSDLSIDIMKACKSFTEKSKSGHGIHIYIKGTLPFGGRNNRNGVEIYQTGRFFIMTGRCLVYDRIVEDQAAIDYVVEKYFPEVEKTSTGISVKTAPFYTPVFEKPSGQKISLRPKYPKITPGSRNQSLTSLAGQLHSRGYTKEQIYKELLRCNQEACSPPLPTREIESIVNSVTRYQR